MAARDYAQVAHLRPRSPPTDSTTDQDGNTVARADLSREDARAEAPTRSTPVRADAARQAATAASARRRASTQAASRDDGVDLGRHPRPCAGASRRVDRRSVAATIASGSRPVRAPEVCHDQAACDRGAPACSSVGLRVDVDAWLTGPRRRAMAVRRLLRDRAVRGADKSAAIARLSVDDLRAHLAQLADADRHARRSITSAAGRSLPLRGRALTCPPTRAVRRAARPPRASWCIVVAPRRTTAEVARRVTMTATSCRRYSLGLGGRVRPRPTDSLPESGSARRRRDACRSGSAWVAVVERGRAGALPSWQKRHRRRDPPPDRVVDRWRRARHRPRFRDPTCLCPATEAGDTSCDPPRRSTIRDHRRTGADAACSASPPTQADLTPVGRSAFAAAAKARIDGQIVAVLDGVA